MPYKNNMIEPNHVEPEISESNVCGRHRPVFVDVFAGCGGLSLGLMQAGWNGLFAIEKEPNAFQTLSSNLLNVSAPYRFSWPEWLPQEPICATKIISDYRENLSPCVGEIDLLAGGPPCQGYSFAGRREKDDPRNQLFLTYLELVDFLRPKIVLLENVRGITMDFKPSDGGAEGLNYAAKLVGALSSKYNVFSKMLDLASFGVPQSRSRFFLIGLRKDHQFASHLFANPLDAIEANRLRFLRDHGIGVTTSAKAAISDLEIGRNGTEISKENKRFKAILYKKPITPFQRLMHGSMNGTISDTRLANHHEEIAARFDKIIKACHEQGRLSVPISQEIRDEYNLKKKAIRVLDPDRPSPTITSMPEDLLHYGEARTLTVRENARLQSFPDWFIFQGKYTTGGLRRRFEVPRFTQVANAVPPLAAEAIGQALLSYV